VQAGNPIACQTLIECNASLNASDRDAMTPLHLAAIAGNCGITQLLLNSKANIEQLDKVDSELFFFSCATLSHRGLHSSQLFAEWNDTSYSSMLFWSSRSSKVTPSQ
jgi:ankyrin repeat protein